VHRHGARRRGGGRCHRHGRRRGRHRSHWCSRRAAAGAGDAQALCRAGTDTQQ
jgi:hypothetical protein